MQDRLERVLDELVQLTPGAHDLAGLASDAIVVERPAVALAVGLRDFRGCGHACHRRSARPQPPWVASMAC